MNGTLIQTILELVPTLGAVIENLGHKPKDSELQALILAHQTKMFKEGLDALGKKLDTSIEILQYTRSKVEQLSSNI